MHGILVANLYIMQIIISVQKKHRQYIYNKILVASVNIIKQKHPSRILQQTNNIAERGERPHMVHPLRQSKRQRTMARHKTNRQVVAKENRSSKETSEGRETKSRNKNIRRRPHRKGKKEKTVKPRKNNESNKKCASESIYMQCKKCKK